MEEFHPRTSTTTIAADTLDDITAATCIVLFVAPPLSSFLNTLVTETVIIIFKLLLDHPKQTKLHESLSLSLYIYIYRSIDLDADHELQSKCRKARKTKKVVESRERNKELVPSREETDELLGSFWPTVFFRGKISSFLDKEIELKKHSKVNSINFSFLFLFLFFVKFRKIFEIKK